MDFSIGNKVVFTNRYTLEKYGRQILAENIHIDLKSDPRMIESREAQAQLPAPRLSLSEIYASYLAQTFLGRQERLVFKTARSGIS